MDTDSHTDPTDAVELTDEQWRERLTPEQYEVLRRNGYETIVPEQVCCGLPRISNGLYESARGRARTNLGSLADYARRGYRIVGTSTSCTHTLKAEYREMLDLDDDDTRAVSGATWDICEFLLDLHDQGRCRPGQAADDCTFGHGRLLGAFRDTERDRRALLGPSAGVLGDDLDAPNPRLCHHRFPLR